ncbi:M56 family metallopeptidase [Xanthomonas cerealis pv. cerealis]|uniref:M56 family metallopeptidase n=1 Tax=Xanthomonas cerealis TaxID=3390025 RepID=UPI001F1930AC|nr:M56 family metallopeptidase [Xanthomonas translucens]UKE69664.1 M56 family metallopeptidase [Xanthomonas translucens pv. pistacia]
MDTIFGTRLFEVLLSRLLATSVQAAVLVAAIWALCRWLPSLPAAARCRLWWLVGAQTMLGLVWAGAVHLPVLPAVPAPAALAATALPAAARQNPAATSATSPASPHLTASQAASAAAPLPWAQVLAALWLAGVLLGALRSGHAYRASRRLVQASTPCSDAALLGALCLAAAAHGLRQPPQLRLSTQIDSPQLIGPWWPVLLLPARRLAAMHADDLDMALTHELVHLQCRDLWWGLLPALAQHLFFFHPLVQLAVREYALAREAACDAAVMAGHRHCRHNYARLLLQLGVAPRPAAGVASASPSFVSLKRRLLMLQSTASFSRLGAGLITAAIALAGVMPLRLVAKPAPATAPAVPAVPAPAVPILASVLAPPAPAVPAAAAPPAAPAAPVASLQADAPLLSQGRVSLSQHGDQDAYVLVQDGHNLMDASLDDLHEARRLAGDDGEILWFRHDGLRYMVRDPAALARFQALHAQTLDLADAQAELGDQQGDLGERQGELGERMAELSAQMAESAARQAEAALAGSRGTASQAQIDRVAAQRAAEQMRRQELGKKIQDLARQQMQLGLQQSQLGKQQADASVRARQQAEQLIRQAIAQGLATPIDG